MRGIAVKPSSFRSFVPKHRIALAVVLLTLGVSALHRQTRTNAAAPIVNDPPWAQILGPASGSLPDALPQLVWRDKLAPAIELARAENRPLFITLRCLSTARLARDKLGRYISLAFGTVFGCQALVNLGMILGLVPTVGIPLPLMSYGGSSLMATLMGFGLVLNVRMRRFVN